MSSSSNEKKIRLKPTWFDLVILLVSLAMAIGALIYVNVKRKHNEQLTGDRIAHVKHDNKEIKTVNLEQLEQVESFVMSPDQFPKMMGELTVIFDKEHGIAVTDAHCPDKKCQKQGYINVANTPIVCLPNDVIVTITMKGTSHGGGILG